MSVDDCYSNSASVCRRYNITPRTLHRWMRDPSLNFPRPREINGRYYWPNRALDAFDAAPASEAAA